MSSSFEFGQTTQGKVIKTSELQRELKKLYKTELSFAEKLYHYTLDKAGSTLAKAAYLKDYLFGDFGLRLFASFVGK